MIRNAKALEMRTSYVERDGKRFRRPLPPSLVRSGAPERQGYLRVGNDRDAHQQGVDRYAVGSGGNDVRGYGFPAAVVARRRGAGLLG